MAKELFASKSIRATSINKIAKLSGVGKGTVFHHFENKEALILAVFHDIFGIFREVFDRLVEDFHNNPADYKSIFRSHLVNFYLYEKNNPSLGRFILDFLSEYVNPDNQSSELFEKLMVEFAMYEQKLVSIFIELGINNPNIKAGLFFTMLDGVAFQLEMIPDVSDEIQEEFIVEMIAIVEFWVNRGQEI